MSAPNVVCLASWNVDFMARIAQPLARGQTVMSPQLQRLPGGKGSNAAVACARQGAQVCVIARVGDDDLGQMALSLWTQEGMNIGHVVRAKGESSGVALIMVYDDGDNSIAVYPGAGAGMTAQHVLAAQPQIAQAQVLVSNCEVPLAATQAAFECARKNGVLTLLNPAPANPVPDTLWPLVDVLTPNEGELLAHTGEHDVAAAAQVLLQRGVGAVVVTLGAQGCCLYRAGLAPLAVAGHAVRVVDTVGAGDTFTGTLAAALAAVRAGHTEKPQTQEWQAIWPQALAQANAAAALSTQAVGAVSAMPTLEAVRAWLAQA